jgi:hypothetical protein
MCQRCSCKFGSRGIGSGGRFGRRYINPERLRQSGAGFVILVTPNELPDLKCEILVKSCHASYGITCMYHYLLCDLVTFFSENYSHFFPKQKLVLL